jgi:iron complex transport system ATP-binding protein
MPAGRTLLELENARVVRDGRAILDVGSLVIRQGEHLAILGPNGAGKSTLIGLLTRDVLPLWSEPPAVRFLGRDRVPLDEVRGLVGVVSAAWQEVVDVHLPVRDVVLGGRFGTLGVPPHVRGRVAAADRSAAAAALAELGLAELSERDMRTLSTGEARRALIARAIVHDPSILVLDEPCAGLDPTAAWQLRATMRHLAAGERTLVLVTHHVEDIVRGIERVVLMRDGAVVADGSVQTELTDDSLSALYGLELELEKRDGEYRLW